MSFFACNKGITRVFYQEFKDRKGTETFAKELKLAKLLQELKPTPGLNNKKVQWFFSYVCNGKFAAFWLLFCKITCKWVLFSNFYHRFVFLLAFIDC